MLPAIHLLRILAESSPAFAVSIVAAIVPDTTEQLIAYVQRRALVPDGMQRERPVLIAEALSLLRVLISTLTQPAQADLAAGLLMRQVVRSVDVRVHQANVESLLRVLTMLGVLVPCRRK
jgi:hypothetical protein